MSSSNPGKTLLASRIAKQYTTEVANAVAQLPFVPTLVGFLANSDPAAQMYARWTQKTAEELGFKYELRTVDRYELETEINKANVDAEVHGIMVYFPVFGDSQDAYLQQCVAAEKDVEGLNHLYYHNMYHNVRFLDEAQTLKLILPCTPLAIVKVLEYLEVYLRWIDYGNRLFGKTVVVVNRLEIVGRPLAALLANDGATVYLVDIGSIQKFTRGDKLLLQRHKVEAVENVLVEELASKADVIITGVPAKGYKFPTSAVRPGCVCVNFSSEKNFDDDVKAVAGLYVPSIGKVTIAMLLRNLLRLIENGKVRRASVVGA